MRMLRLDDAHDSPGFQMLRLHRNSTRDILGEYVTVDSWGGELVLQESKEHHLRVVLKVGVSGRKRKDRLWPDTVIARVECGGISVETSLEVKKGSSLLDIERTVAHTDFSGVIGIVAQKVYQPHHATCISRKIGDTYEPFLTGVAPSWGFDYLTLPAGEEYLAVQRTHRGLEATQINRSWGGYGSGRIELEDLSAHYWIGV